MWKNVLVGLASVATLLLASARLASAHGLIEDPPSRNWFCGAITKPDEVSSGTAQYPVCGDAFNAPGMGSTDGYSFMSVLTHTEGRSVEGPRTNVCGFNSETWNGRATVWDQPINWPTNSISAGLRTFTWNISWGPHFSDTQEFRYWITKPGFQFQVGTPLSFNDFEAQPFCILNYDDSQPNANANVIPDKAAAKFATRCNVPARSGRHVIYAEWGRNQFTFERFHGCVDVVFGPGNPAAINAEISLNPDVSEFSGSGTMQLDASGSTGSNLTYQWTVSAPSPSLYTLSNANQQTATLALATPQAAATVTVTLVVSNGTASDSATRTFVHSPATSSAWFDLGPLTAQSQTLSNGDQVSVRTVDAQGQDTYWPASPFVVTAATAGAAAWPLALAQAINAGNGAVRVGVLSPSDDVVPTASATANRIYALTTANMVSAFLQVTSAPPTNTGVTIQGAVASNSPWFNEHQVQISNTRPLSSLTVTIGIQKSPGLGFSGQYNTVGGTILQSYTDTPSAINYQFTLVAGQTLAAGTNRTFAAQTGAGGVLHPTSGDTYAVSYVVDGVTYTQNGTF